MPYPCQIFQSPKAFFVAYEYAGATRNVYLKDPGPAPVDSWMGQSVGKWEGETFVIDVTGFNDSSWFDRAFPQRVAARRRALHADEPGRHQLRSDDRGSEDVHEAVED
jgi:hypothetical protein